MRGLSSGELGLLGKELGVDVGEDTSLRDDYTAEETVQLLIVSDSELQVTGDDTGLLVVTVEGRSRG